MQTTVTPGRKMFTREVIDIETFIAITLQKQIRATIFVGTKCMSLAVDRADVLAQFRANGVQQVRVDEYGTTVYICADI